MPASEYNLCEHKPASDPAEDSGSDDSRDDDAYRHRQEHGRERTPLSDEVRDRRAYLDRVL